MATTCFYQSTNLPQSQNEPCFLLAGPLTKVTICKDKEGKPKSFGFVCFKHKESVPYAIALLNGIRLYGRPIKVQYRFGSSHSSELNSPTHGFENYIDLYSSSYRYHQEPYGNPPFPVTPFPMTNSLPHEYSGFQKMNQAANFKSAQSSFELALPRSGDCEVHQVDDSTSKRKREQQSCDSDTSIEDDKMRQRKRDQKYKKCKAKKKMH
ncbi:PREDICTED: splicing regulator RBM11 [Nipponia nippon]|uniref:splicing regulator RBM11 n=1 Tax=Nipponia nippon TaxID=128390 RepID=UPI0005119291|nr:PREDICTED: splicing regulator RBM11 [Nipponia nippon]